MRRDAGSMRVIGFMGFHPRLPRHLQGLLRRCDWTAVCRADLSEWLHYTVQPDVLVCNAGAIDSCGCADDEALSTLLTRRDQSGPPVPLIFVGGRHVQVPPVLRQYPVHVLVRPGTYYERFGRLVREVLSPADRCCGS